MVRNFKKRSRYVAYSLLSLIFSIAVVAEEATVMAQTDDSHHQDHEKFLPSRENTKTYTCDVSLMSNQCRRYEILSGSDDTLNELIESCESMGGKFELSVCPAVNEIARCIDIVRNYHRPDVIYDNIYYSGASSIWDEPTVARVCIDLGGELVSN